MYCVVSTGPFAREQTALSCLNITDQVRPGDIGKRQLENLSVYFYYNLLRIRYTLQPTLEILASQQRHRQLDLRDLPGKALEIGQLEQRPVDPRRRNLQVIGLVDRFLDIEQATDLVADCRAVINADAFLAIDIVAQGAVVAGGRELDTDEFIAHRLDNGRKQFGQITHRQCLRKSNKKGPTGPFDYQPR